jgi:predicted component of type VI protein secretion system
MANWVLKFISGKYQGGEFPLEEGHEYYIGRSSESDMVLVEDMVSRQHARIAVREDVVHLEDLGSTNGSFVNGERVNNRALEPGDRILFGTSIIKLMHVAAGAATDATAGEENVFEQPEEPSARKTMSMPPQTMVMPPTQTMAGAMSGLLQEVSLPDLLQLFSTSRKSGVLRLHDAEQRAAVYLREGRVVFAEIDGLNDLPPDKAAYRVMGWTQGMFVLEPPSDRVFENELEMSTEAMMMEAMRLMDEMEQLKHNVPDMDARLTLVQPLEPPLRSLTPELLDTLQLVHNHTVVAAILDASLGGDLETMQDIDYLLKHGYIAQG